MLPTRIGRAVALCAAAVFACTAMAACGGGDDSGTTATTSAGSATISDGGGGGTLTLGSAATPKSFAADQAESGALGPYYQAVYDTLIREQPDRTLVPMLATEWSYNTDRTVLTMKLRTDVKFVDGTAFDATVAKQNLDRFKASASPNAYQLALVSDVTVVDPATITITLSEPDPALLLSLSGTSFMQSPGSFDNSDIATNPSGSGPYILDTSATVVGSSYVFTKNPNYWSPDLQKYDKVVLNVYNDPTALLNALKSKQLNGAALSDNTTADQVKAAGYTLTPGELDWTGLVLLDRDGTLNPALKSVEVRQAINYAFDKEGLLKAYGNGYGTVTGQVFPTTSDAYDPALDTEYAYDPEKAKQLLADAGYPDGFTLEMPTSTALGTTLPALIQQQLEAVGIKVQYTDAGNNFVADIIAGKYAATWFRLAEQADWQIIQAEIAPEAQFNPFKSTDPDVAKLIDEIHTGDPDNVGTALKDLNTFLVKNAWFAPWYRPQSLFATDSATNVEIQSDFNYPFLYSFSPK
jgi:peptide/nickel transport system substrate-binding protein